MCMEGSGIGVGGMECSDNHNIITEHVAKISWDIAFLLIVYVISFPLYPQVEKMLQASHWELVLGQLWCRLWIEAPAYEQFSMK